MHNTKGLLVLGLLLGLTPLVACGGEGEGPGGNDSVGGSGGTGGTGGSGGVGGTGGIGGAGGVGGFGGSAPECGDGIAQGDEACDGDDLGGATCGSLGFAGGMLSCDGCELVTDACTATEEPLPEVEPNDVADDATVVELPAFVTGTIAGADTGDLWLFMPEVGKQYRMRVATRADGSCPDDGQDPGVGFQTRNVGSQTIDWKDDIDFPENLCAERVEEIITVSTTRESYAGVDVSSWGAPLTYFLWIEEI